MNILVFSWRGPGHPLAGGAEQVMHEHMKGWVDAGHTVTLFTSRYEGGKRIEKVDGVKIIRRGIQYWGVQLLGALYYLFSGDKYDLVVDQFHGIPFFTPLYSRVPRLAVVQEVPREVWLKNHLPKPFNYFVGFIGYIGEPLIYLIYRRTQFMVGSKSAKEDLSKIGIPKKNTAIVPHGVILPVKNPKVLKSKINTIIFLGALAIDKGIEDAIETFGILNEKGKYRFWIIGKGGGFFLQFLKKKVLDLGIKDATTFFGFVSQKKKFELLKEATVMVNPSLLEGWGLVNIEANAMGTPVVAYKSRGLVDSVKNGISGEIISENTPEGLAESVDRLTNDRKRLLKLQNSCVDWSNKYNWKKSRAKSLKLIEKVA